MPWPGFSAAGPSHLRNWLMAISPNPWFLVAGFIVVFGGIYAILTLPLDYYSGFVLPHRFDQSNQTLRDWIIDQLKGLAVGAPIGLLLLELLYLALRVTGDLWWLWAAGGHAGLQRAALEPGAGLDHADIQQIRPAGRRARRPGRTPAQLAEKANTKVRGVFKFDMSRRTKSANAALTGIGNTRRIVLGDTLIDEFTNDEIETVLAHELGHHVHNDLPLLIALGTLLTTVGLYLASLALEGQSASSALPDPPMWLPCPLWASSSARMGCSPCRWRTLFRAGVRTWRMIMPCRLPARRKPLLPRLRAWPTRTWAKSTRRNGWCSCSIRIRRWGSGFRRRRNMSLSRDHVHAWFE
jgi:Zn-dependent protease with chaperone function